MAAPRAAVGFDDHTVFWNHRSIVALVTILIDTMKFATSVVAIALAAAAPCVLGTSAEVDLSENIKSICKYLCSVGDFGVRNEQVIKTWYLGSLIAGILIDCGVVVSEIYPFERTYYLQRN